MFFFKQKTAYEMRISDWSSDVCSSDLTKNGSFGQIPGRPSFEVNPFQGAIQVAGATIGVVDDDDDIRAALDGLLQSAGFRVVTFASASSEECRVGKGCVRTFRCRWSQ